MTNEAIILAGGLGKRLQNVTKNIPKPMVSVGGRYFLEYLLDYLAFQGIEKVILSVGYKFEVIKRFLGDRYKDIHIYYCVEQKPLGTGGGIKKAFKLAENDIIFVINGDTFFNINLRNFYKFFNEKSADLAIALKFMKNYDRYGTVEIDKTQMITCFLEKGYRQNGLINGGIYLLKKDLLDEFKSCYMFSFEKDFLEKYYEVYNFFGFPSDSYFCDIGVPEDLKRINDDYVMLKCK